MKYAITGGAGFIGSHLAKALVEQGHEVVIVDNLTTGSRDNISEIQDKLKFYDIDVRNYAEIREKLEGMDGIFHHAALISVPESYRKEGEYYEVNVQGTKNILDASRESGTKVVFASSSGVYGNTDAIPTPENAELNPVNPYGKTKLEAERIAKNYWKDIEVIGLRYYNVYGNTSRSKEGVISKFYQSVSSGRSPVVEGDGSQTRDFVSVDDVVSATLLAMERKTGSAFINIGSGKSISILDLATLFIRCSKTNLKPVFERGPDGNVKRSMADISLAGKLIGWRPQTKLEEWVENLFRK